MTAPLYPWLPALSQAEAEALARVCIEARVSVAEFARFCVETGAEPHANNVDLWPYFARAAERMARVHSSNQEHRNE